MKMMKYLGIAIMVMSIFLVVVVYTLSSALIDSIDMGSHCSSVSTCPHVATLNYSYVGYIFSIILFSLGLYLFIKEPGSTSHKKPKNLEPDEKRVYDIITQEDGMIFQSDLVEKTGFPKARVTRVLDKLEAKKVLVRHRRGMTNAVVLK